MKSRYRFGFRGLLGPLFPNIGTFVIYLNDDTAKEWRNYVVEIQVLASQSSYANIAQTLFFEKA